MNSTIDFIMGVSWSLTYVAAIFLSIKNKTWCIPGLAICMNFAWEFWAVTNRFLNGGTGTLPFWIQFAWLVLDIGILCSWLYFDRATHRQLTKNIVTFLAVFFVVYLWAYCAKQWEFSVFFINVVMSIAFIVQRQKVASFRGAWFIALGKLIGTLAATVLNGFIFRSHFVLWLGGICFLLDSYYFTLILDNRVQSR